MDLVEQARHSRELTNKGETALRRIFSTGYLPQTAPEALALTSGFDDALNQAVANGERFSRQELQDAQDLANWRGGEFGVANEYFAGLGEIGKTVASIETTRLGKKIWIVDGKEVSAQEVKTRAAEQVLLDREKSLQDVVKLIDPTGSMSVAQFNSLSPKERGRYHAAQVLLQAGQGFVVARETGAAQETKAAYDGLVAQKDDLTGLDDSAAQRVLKEAAKHLPGADQAANLGVSGVLGEASFLGQQLAAAVDTVTRDVVGRSLSATELAAGVDLADRARKRVSEAVWLCVQAQVKAYELSEENKVGGLAALRGKMRGRKLDEDLLWRPYRERNLEDQARAIMDLDAVYRAVFESQAGEFVPGIFSAGQFWAGVDPDRAKVIIGTLVRPEDLRSLVVPGVTRTEDEQREDLRKLNDLLATAKGRGGVQERLRVERARKMFGVDKAGRDADKYQDVAGYLNFIAWSLSRHGEYKDERTDQGISWVPGDPIVPERIKESTALWFKEYVMESVDPHLSATKKAGVDPNQIIQIVLWAELARREGIDLGDFASQVAATNGSGAARRGIANNICQAASMRGTLIEALVGTTNTPGALVELAPLLTPEGRLNYVAVMERLKVRAWGEKTQWQQLADIEADLFKHLPGATKGEAMELFYQVGYETQFRNYRDNALTGGKPIPDEIDALVSGQKFLRYRTRAEMGLDFNSSLSQSIGEFLKRNPAWAAFAGENIGRYVKTAGRRGAEGTSLEGLPDDARIEILKNLGIDITRPLPEPGYKSWRNNLDSLIKNAKELGYDKYDKDKEENDKIMVTLRAFNGEFHMDPQHKDYVPPKDVVLEFKWRLARAAYKKYLGLGETMLQKERGITVDEIWERLKIEQDGLLSRSEYAQEFYGAWRGDILARQLEQKLNISLPERLVRAPGAELEKMMIAVFDFLHGQKIPRFKTFIPDFAEAPLNAFLPADMPNLIALVTNVALGWSLGQFLAGGSLLEAQAAFHAFPLLDKVPLIGQALNLIPSWIKTVPLSPEFSGTWIAGALWNLLMPFPFSGLKVQAYLFNWSLEGINSILVRNRWGRLLSERELKKSRVPKGESK